MKNYNNISEHIKPTAQARDNSLKGLVLAGGASLRMGRDKGNLVYYNQPQKYHMAKMLTGLGLDTWISQREDQQNSGKFQYITDKYKNIGPMAGLLSAFEYCNTPWLVVGCDYPLIGSEHLKELLSQRDKNKLATVFLDENSGFLVSTIAIYEPAMLPLMQQHAARKEYAIRKLLKNNDIKILKTRDRAFKSINTPDACVAIQKEIRKMRGSE